MRFPGGSRWRPQVRAARRAALVMSMLVWPLAAAAQDGILPEPSGPHAVGRRLLYLTDSTRSEPGTSDPADHREIVVTIWYPAARGGARAGYMPNLDRYSGLIEDETIERWRGLMAPVGEDAAVASGRFPVLLFVHGWNARSASYSDWLTEMASRGYVVIGLDLPFLGAIATRAGAQPASFDHFDEGDAPDRFFAGDVAFVLEQLPRLDRDDPVLRGALDMNAVFGAGHSSGFGSAISPQAALGSGLRAIVSFDSGLSRIAREAGLAVPVLLMRSDTSYTALYARPAGETGRGAVYDSATIGRLTGGLVDLVIANTGHNAVFDAFTADDPERRAFIHAIHGIQAYYVDRFLRDAIAGRAPILDVREEDRGRVRIQVPSVTAGARGSP